MIQNDELSRRFNSNFVRKFVPTNVKRVIIPIPKNVMGKNVKYIGWDGQVKSGNGFLFQNETDNRLQYVSTPGGIIIGHEGECPSGKNDKMILRSQAVMEYLRAYPDALLDETHIFQTITYFKNNIFKHAVDNPSVWDENAVSDIWSSDVNWLKKNFNTHDIMTKSGELFSVIQACKKTEILIDGIYLKPHLSVEGKGETGDKGAWALRKPDGVIDLCQAEIFWKTYIEVQPKDKSDISDK